MMENHMTGGAAFMLIIIAGLLQCAASDQSTAADTPLVLVNGKAVTQADLETAFLVRGVPPERQAALRRAMLDRLVDERLIGEFLQRRRVKPNEAALDAQVDRILALIHRRGEEPDEFLARLGMDRQQIREQLSLPIAWESYAREVIVSAEIEAYFQMHRRELDGTQVRARHILLKVPEDAPEAACEEAVTRLENLRREIEAGHRSFNDAARDVSQAPSASQGGDVGFFAHRGTMSAAFADAAFRLKPGEVSQPIRTNAGVHLIEVTDERPGQLSFEDVRSTVFDRLAGELWDKQVSAERATATIIWREPGDAGDSC